MYHPLNTEMYCLKVESRLANFVFGPITIEVNPKAKVSNIVYDFLSGLEKENKICGLAVYDEHNCKLDWNATIESQRIEEGSNLFIAQDRSNVFKPVHIAVIGISTIVIACILFIATAVLFGTTGGVVPFDYGIVIDAGSTHTEVFLYQWSGSKEQGTGNVHQRDSCEYEVGIAEGIDPVHVLSCVNNVTRLVPPGILPVLYLGATAGMRILNITNPTDASLILMSLKYALMTSQVLVKSVNIIQGEEEALFSWISTNFLTRSLMQTEMKSTYGALDLGGASTQFAFAVQNQSLKNESDLATLKLYGHEYVIKASSYLCFGYMEAMYRHEAVMLMENSSSILNDPCLPMGYVEKIATTSFSKNPCISSLEFTSWIQNNSISEELIINGAGNYEECKASVMKIINQSACEESGFKQCLPNIDLSALNMNFTAFSGFFYVVHFLNGSKSLEEFRNTTKNWCNFTWEEIKSTHKRSEIQYIVRYCFAATYIIELFVTKYGFDSSTWSRIYFTKKIESTDIGWTLGYMINATNAIPEKLPSPPTVSFPVFVILTSLSIIMVIVSIAIIKMYVKWKISLFSRHNYLLEE